MPISSALPVPQDHFHVTKSIRQSLNKTLSDLRASIVFGTSVDFAVYFFGRYIREMQRPLTYLFCRGDMNFTITVSPLVFVFLFFDTKRLF